MVITGVSARQILDSRGMPTVECDVYVDAGFMTSASVPSGLSRSTYECYERRDNDRSFYHDNSVMHAVASITLLYKTKAYWIAARLSVY